MTTTTHRETCWVCGNAHPGSITTNEAYDAEGATHAREEDVAVAQANQPFALRAWHEASATYGLAAIALNDFDRLYKGSSLADRRRMRPVRESLRKAHCRAILAMWRLPHPTQTKNLRVGCL